jgi:nucleotide-binding universal stress UspA family protein
VVRVIVVGVDGSDISREALRFALDEASIRNTGVRAVLAWSAIPVVPMQAPGVDPGIDIEPLRDAAHVTLREAVEAVAGAGAADVEQVVVEGQAGEAILAHSDDAQLIVVGTHAHGALAELILGSVSHHVVKHARCPVVVVPPLAS